MKESTIKHLRGLVEFAGVDVKVEALNSQGAYTIRDYSQDDLDLLIPVLRVHGYYVDISPVTLPYIRKAQW